MTDPVNQTHIDLASIAEDSNNKTDDSLGNPNNSNKILNPLGLSPGLNMTNQNGQTPNLNLIPTLLRAANSPIASLLQALTIIAIILPLITSLFGSQVDMEQDLKTKHEMVLRENASLKKSINATADGTKKLSLAVTRGIQQLYTESQLLRMRVKTLENAQGITSTEESYRFMPGWMFEGLHDTSYPAPDPLAPDLP